MGLNVMKFQKVGKFKSSIKLISSTFRYKMLNILMFCK